MRKNVTLLLIALCFTATAQNNPTTEPQSKLYISHVTVIDTETGKEATDQTVVISDGRISDVANSNNVAVPAKAHTVDGRGKYLIPGLWDMHVHATRFDSTLPLYIANGVTGVREMFGPPDANKFRAELAAKHLVAPHIYLASPIVDGKPPVWPDSIEVATADEARRAVDEQKQRGADFIKVYSLLSRDAYFAIVDEARRQSIPVAGHVPNSVTLLEAAAAKQQSIEHLIGMDLACSSREKDLRPKILAAKPIGIEFDSLVLAALQSYSDERCKGVFAELKKNGSWPVPTLTVWRSVGMMNDPQFTSDNRVRYFSGEFRNWLNGSLDARMKEWSASQFGVRRDIFTAESKLTGELFRAGVPMLAGTDVGNPFCFPGFSLHDELALLVEAGVTPLGALQMATRNPALFMGATAKYGSITPGKVADLVLLDADPLKDIHNTTKISEVFLDGKEYDRPALDQILASAEKSANAQQTLTMPGPDVQNFMLGTWSTKVQYPPSPNAPNGDTGEGTEVWRAGPGGRSVIEESREKNSKGEIEGLGVAWWDKKAQGQRFVWCDNSIPDGCYVSKEVAKWNRNDLTWREEQDLDGTNRVYSETFKNITADSFRQVLQEGGPGQPLQNTATISALRKSEPAMIPDRSMDESSSNAEAELHTFMNELRRANIQGDTDTVANSITDDYIQTDISGYRQDKTTWLNEYFKPLADLIKAGKFHWDKFERTDLQFRFYGRCAIVTGELHAKGTGAKPGPQHTWVPDRNASFSGILHFTHVYIRQNGRWMLAALHNQIPPPPVKATN
jgi:imidazolonepropionase-like amidohydrolase/ketosteroid isomerase-like protein